MSEERRILGIDFGTTNSKMAFIEMDEPTMIENREGEINTPSVVYFKKADDVIVGEEAKRNIIPHPERTVYSVKRKMGTEFRKKIHNATYPPEYIGAYVVRKILEDAEKRVGIGFKDAVISVPANFSDNRRQAIKDTGEIAGLNVVRMINEPTAAALAYGYGEEDEKRIMIYDFGGGTFDVSILTVGDGFFDVDATRGEKELGGDDIDRRLEKLIAKKIKDENGTDVTNDLRALQMIREASEAAKCALSHSPSTRIELPFLTKNAKGSPVNFEMDLTRKRLNKMIAGIVGRTREPVERAMEDAALEIDDIDDIILVGGTTKIPYVREFIERTFGRNPVDTIDPYEAVALGAAIAGMSTSAARTRKGPFDIDISDVASNSFGVGTADGTISHIIDRNVKIPAERTRPYTNALPFIEEVSIPVYQGENVIPEENDLLGEFRIDIEPKPLFKNNIEVTFKLGEEFGILDVTAKDADSGNMRNVKMEAKGRLSVKAKNKWMKRVSNMRCKKVDVEKARSKTVATLYLHPHMTFGDVKKELGRMDVLKEREDLFHNKTRLRDGRRVSESKIRSGSRLKIRRTLTKDR